MKIGIDISQIAYEGTGVANFLKNLLIQFSEDKKNEYVLFYASARGLFFSLPEEVRMAKHMVVRRYAFPPWFLDLLWNRLHIFPVEWLLGHVDVFLSSDWTEPPTIKAKRVTILYDLTIYKYPDETDIAIVKTQKRKLAYVKKESDLVLCISEATKQDAKDMLHVPDEKLKVIYPGI